MISCFQKYYNYDLQEIEKSNQHYLYPPAASSPARFLNSSYIFLLKFSLRKKDQNLNKVFISCDWPIPNFFRSKQGIKSINQLSQTLQYSKMLAVQFIQWIWWTQLPFKHLEWYFEYWSWVKLLSLSSACDGCWNAGSDCGVP